MTELENLQEVQRVVGGLVVQVSDWDAATPCPAMPTKAVVAHLTGGDAMIADLLADRAFDPSTLGPPSAAGYAAAADALIAAYQVPGSAEKTIMAPIGPASGGQMMIMRTIEHVAHGWDVAVSQGLPTDELEPFAAPLIPVCEALFVQLADVVGERRPFAEPVPVPAEAPALDRFVGLLGRNPRWSPTASR
jgi:uncharacterized protein (TIGR03086 family)